MSFFANTIEVLIPQLQHKLGKMFEKGLFVLWLQNCGEGALKKWRTSKIVVKSKRMVRKRIGRHCSGKNKGSSRITKARRSR